MGSESGYLSEAGASSCDAASGGVSSVEEDIKLLEECARTLKAANVGASRGKEIALIEAASRVACVTEVIDPGMGRLRRAAIIFLAREFESRIPDESPIVAASAGSVPVPSGMARA